jgi:prepilin peptidase CpaA
LLVVLLPVWARGYLGGGDLKMAVATAAWVGLGRMPQYLLATALAGGILAVLSYLRAGAEARRAIRANALQLHVPAWSDAMRVQGTAAMVPYGAAFAAGALFAVLG